MNLELWKQRKKTLKLTNQKISDISGIPKRTVEDIFAGVTKYPRADTVQAIEKALGLENADANVPAEIQELINSIAKLQPSEIEEISNFVDFVVSKRK